jgi:hypothetical protein
LINSKKSRATMAESSAASAISPKLGLELQYAAAEIKRRAEWKAGQVLADLALRGGDRKSNSHDESLTLDDHVQRFSQKLGDCWPNWQGTVSSTRASDWKPPRVR